MISTEAAKSHCQNCQAERLDGVDECIRCGIIFTKYRLLAKRAAVSPSQTPFMESRWVLTAKQWLIESDETTDSLTLVGRAMLLLSLVWWGRTFIFAPPETNYTGESVLHLINLPFHEAGHLIISPACVRVATLLP